MGIQHIGDIGGQSVGEVRLERGPLGVRLVSYGARMAELWVPGRDGRAADIVLGHDTLDGYLSQDAYFGATCGRFSNRIAGGRFEIGGAVYQLSQNEGDNHLHGGAQGFEKKVWTIADLSPEHVVFTAESPDGEMGYPGACSLTVEYWLTGDDALRIVMTATTDKPTPINLVHHGYFNLAGHDSGPVLEQELMIPASTYLPVGDGLIPTGKVRSVEGTSFDFRTPRKIGATIADAPGGRGYDHNWCLDDSDDPLRLCAIARDPVSGRALELRTSEPGVQFYTGGYLSDAIVGKGGRPLCPYAGFTLETQQFPNAPNEPGFPNTILSPGEEYRHVMEFRFFAD